MKAKDFAALLNRVENECQNETHEDDELAALFIEREVDRAVRKARRDVANRGTECPVCGWKPKRAKGSRP